jgi:hypothetical protein
VCIKLIAALEACDKGSEGPLGSVRKSCIQSANTKYKCDMPVDEVRKLLKKYFFESRVVESSVLYF